MTRTSANKKARARAQAKSISLELELDLHHSPAKVWRALTDPALLSEWLLPVVGLKLELEPGAVFMFQAPPLPGWNGIVDCRFTEIEAQRKLSCTWVVGNLNTFVTFTLTPTASGTHLSLVHSGFTPEQKPNLGGARYGWKLMGKQLVHLLARIP
jgi:uncharacterized protein YndB with AHSA1/START domain